MCRMARKHLAAKRHARLRISDARDRVGDVQFPGVGPGFADGGKIQVQVTERFITVLRASQPVLGNPTMGFRISTLPQPLSDLREVGRNVEREIAVSRFAGIQRVIVELELLGLHPAKDHRAQPAVAHR